MGTRKIALASLFFLFSVIACNHLKTSGDLSQARSIDSLTAANKANVSDFFTLAFVKKDVKAAFDKYVGDKYIQHNPNAPDGSEHAIKYLGLWFAANPKASCDIKRIIAEKDLVVIHSHWKDSPEKLGQAGIDIFRVEDGKIVEHWDVVQDVPEKSVNNNSVF
jgi:predicted SnoaL-like aldol condensation-catalyzing enzyme